MNAVVDRVVQYPHRYQLKNVNTGEVLGTFDLEPITGTISVVGTKIDKELFDSIASDISARLVSNGGDAKDNVITFNMASARSNVASGEKLSVSLGKIAKYFNDLKAVAFSGSKADIDLGNVDNTSDANKPVSNATQQALNNKANASDVYTKSETDGLLNGKANANDVYSKTKTDELLNVKANKSDVYTKSETDTGLNKSLYNLGYYDTMVENSDGTYTITRQTGYLDSNDLLDSFIRVSWNSQLFETNILLSIITDIGQQSQMVNYILNDTTNYIKDNVYSSGSNNHSVTVIDDRLVIKDTSSDINTFKQYLLQHTLIVQYKLATATTEKVEKNHYAQYNQSFILEHNKGEAERSSNLWDKGDITFGGEYDNLYKKLKAGIYSLRISSTRNTSYGEFHWYIRDLDTATTLLDGILPNNSYTLNVTSEMINHDIRLYSWGTTSSDVCKVMLNEGSVALPYQSYEGKVVHEKELGSYVDTTTRQEINGLKRFNNGVALKRDDTGIFQTDDGANLAIKAFGRDLHFYGKSGVENYVANAIFTFAYSGENNSYVYTFPQKNGTIALTNDFKTINGNSIVGSGDLSITPGIFTKLGTKTNFSFDSGSYLVVANNGLVTVTGEDPLNVGSSASKKYLGIFMVTIAEYDGGQSLRVNTEQVFFADYVSGAISGPTFTIYKLN